MLAFPRHLGTVLPVGLAVRREGGGTHVLPKGSILYTARRGPGLPQLSKSATTGESGCLYVTMEDFIGAGRPKCAELVRRSGRMERGTAEYFLDINRVGSGGRSLGAGGVFYLPEIASLWVANHFASERRAVASWSNFHFDFVAAEREIRMRRNALNYYIL